MRRANHMMVSTRMPGFRPVRLALLVVLLASFVPPLFAFLTGSNETSNVNCGSICESTDCKDEKRLRYGRYCGVGYTGCATVTPCDSLDACCQVRDACVGPNYVNASNCAPTFLQCLRSVPVANQTFANNSCTNITDVVEALKRAAGISGAGAGLLAGDFMGVPIQLVLLSLTAASLLSIL